MAHAGLPDQSLRERIGPAHYDRISGLDGGTLSEQQQRVLDTFFEHRETFIAYDPKNPASYESAARALGQLYGSGDQPSSLSQVRWLLQAGVIGPELSEKMAGVRNRMVFDTCESLARELGVLHRIDFSPASNLLNDIDQTFVSPDILKELGIDGQNLVTAFNERFRERFGVNAEHLDVVSHPGEASIADWRQVVEVHEFVGSLRHGSALLSGNEEAYFLEGAFRMQVERRGFESELDLYTVFAANPHVEDDAVARVVVSRGLIADLKYRYVPPPEMRRSYSWGSSVGNWHFYRRHAAGEPGAAARYAAKYGLRSFAEGPGWLVLFDNRTSSDIAPESYEKMVDMTVREDLVRRVHSDYYEQSGLSADEVWTTIEKARDIRNMGERYSPEAAFGEEARAALPPDASPETVSKMIGELDRRFQADMSRLMIENMKQSLPSRLGDWLDPKVSAYRLGFNLRDIKNEPVSVRRAVDAARKRLRTAALFEVMHGLRVLDPQQREQVIDHAIEDLKQRRGGERFTFERTLQAVKRLASMEAKPRLLQTDAEAGRPGPNRQRIGGEDGEGLLVRTEDQAEVARQQQAEVSSELEGAINEVRSALSDEISPASEGLPLTLEAVLKGATDTLTSRWDQSLREAGETIENRAMLLVSSEQRQEAVSAFRKQLLESMGYEFRKDWRAVEGLDLARDAEGRSMANAAGNLMTWANADALLNVVKVYRETGGNTEKVREQILMEAAGRLPLVGETLQLKAILEGQAHPGMLGVMAAGFFYPAVGQVMLAYSMGSNVYYIITDVQLDADVQLHLQGIIPGAGGEEGPGDAYGEGMPGFLQPVYETMLGHLNELEKRLPVSRQEAEEIQLLIDDLYTRDIRGARNYLYEYFNPMIEERLAANPERWPREEWKRIKLSSDYAPIRSVEPEDLLMPANQPPLLRAMFRKWVNDYMHGRGLFGELPSHRAAHRHPFIREQYFNSADARRDEFNDLVEQMTSLLTASYQNALVAHARGETPDTRMLFDWVEDEDFLLVFSYLYGADAEGLTAYSDRYRDDPTVPDLPAFLEVIRPGGTVSEQRTAFFKFFDDRLNDRLAAHDQYKDMTEDQWLEIKLGKHHADLRSIAAEEQGVAHPLLMAFFNRQVMLYRERLQPLIDAGKLKKRVTGTSPQGELTVNYYNPPAPSGEIQKRMVQQLIRDFRAGMIRAENMRQRETDKEILDAALPNALALDQAGRGIWGDPGTPSPQIADLAYALALQSGDPLIDDQAIAAALDPLLDQPSHAEVEIVGDFPSPLPPGETFQLSCRIDASRDFIRPFRVNWSFAKEDDTEVAESPGGDSGSTLMVTAMPVGAGEQPIVAGSYLIRVEVTDATGRPVDTAERALTIAGLQETVIAGEEAKIMMYVAHSSGPDPNATGFMKFMSKTEMKWEDPTSANANYQASSHPHVWVSWPDHPENHRYYFQGRIEGGTPAVKKDFDYRFGSSPGQKKKLAIEDGRFIIPLPDFQAREHVGKYRITGHLLAFPTDPGSDWRAAEPAAKKPINLTMTYYGVPPTVQSTNVRMSSTGVVSGSIALNNIEAGRRVAAIEVAGATRYAILGNRISFEVPGQTSLPDSATVRFMNFGEEVSIPVKFENTSDIPKIQQLDPGKIQRAQDSVTRADEPDNRTRFSDLARAWDDLAYAYEINRYPVDFDAWLFAKTKALQMKEQIVGLLGNPDWEEYQYNSSYRRLRSQMTVQDIQADFRKSLVYDYTAAANSAAQIGEFDAASTFMDRGEAIAATLENDKDEGEYAWGQIASAASTLSDAVFKQTGDIGKAQEWWSRAEAARRNEAVLRGGSARAGRFKWEVDEVN